MASSIISNLCKRGFMAWPPATVLFLHEQTCGRRSVRKSAPSPARSIPTTWACFSPATHRQKPRDGFRFQNDYWPFDPQSALWLITYYFTIREKAKQTALVFNPGRISDNHQEYMYSFFISLYDSFCSELLIINRNTPYWGSNKVCLQHTQIMASTFRHRKFLIFQSMASGC